ncbi:MAG TPA: sugar-binding protein [Planctomycetota bacterium]|nr:sugar-binding protein [Planctomycetota bacterium]
MHRWKQAALLAMVFLSTGLVAEDETRLPPQILGLPALWIPLAEDPGVLKGDLSAAAWAKAARVTLVDPASGAAPKYVTECRLFCTADALFFGFTCAEPDPGALSTTGTFWKRDEIEIFLEPEKDTLQKPYHQIMADAAGAVETARYHVYPRYVQQKLGAENWAPKLEKATARNAAGWTLEIKLPYSELRIGDAAKTKSTLWRMNLYRTRPPRGADKTLDWAWSPTGSHNFQVGPKFGFALPESHASPELLKAARALPAEPPSKADPAVDEDPPSDEIRKNVEAFEFRTYKGEDGKTLPYRLLKPKNYDPAKKYPLLLSLHGGGAPVGTDNISQLEEFPFQFVTEPWCSKFPCFVAVPQFPPGNGWVLVRNSEASTAVFTETGNYRLAEQPTDSLRMVLEIVAGLQKEFAGLDEKRLYVTGSSAGGYGTWEVLVRQPAWFAAAAPLCGGGDDSRAETIKDVAIWAFHGDQDANVKVTASRAMIAALKKAGGQPLYTEFPGGPHNIIDRVDEPKLIEWMFAQQRK